MATETIPFTGFAFGEYGSLSPFSVGFQVYRAHLLYKGWWTGQNIMRGQDGTLFPRAGEKPYILTGVPNGVLEGVGAGSAGGHPYIWFAVGTGVYRFRADIFTSQAVDTYTNPLGAFTEPLAWVDHSGASYVFAYPAGMYKLDHGTTTVTNIAAGPTAFNCCVLGEQLVAGAGNNLYYTAPDPAGIIPDFENWIGYIQVGDVYNIRSLNTVRSRLAIGKDGFLSQPWFVLSGNPGFNYVLRQAESSLTPPHAEAAVDTGQSVGLVTAIEGTIATFDGSRLHPLPYLLVTSDSSRGVPSELSAFRLRRPGEWGVVTDKSIDAHDGTAGSIWYFRNGAWSRHKRRIPAGVVNGAWSVSLVDETQLVFGQGGDNATPATFCSTNPYLERPAFTASNKVTILDPADCFFSLPEWWARDGSEVAVKAVQVDFLSWGTGDTNPNTFSVAAVAMRTFDPSPDFDGTGGGDVSVAAHRSYSEATAGLSDKGTRRRMLFKFSERYGNAFRLDFTGLRGVSIQKAVAIVDTKPAQV